MSASNALTQEIVSLTDMLWAMEFGRRLAIASLALFLYEHVTTLDKEVLQSGHCNRYHPS
jgi:hypothetical protein